MGRTKIEEYARIVLPSRAEDVAYRLADFLAGDPPQPVDEEHLIITVPLERLEAAMDLEAL